MDLAFEQTLKNKGVPEDLYLLSAVEVLCGINSNLDDQDEGSGDMLVSQALRYLRTKAAKGDMEAKIKLSTVLSSDTSVDQDKREAEIWARSVFDRRIAALLAICIKELDGFDSPGLFRRILEMADAGNALMCHLVGIVLVDGVGFEKDIERGLSYLRTAAKADHANARVDLAAILSDAFRYPGVHDIQSSLTLYEETVNNNTNRRLTSANARAMADLARLYYEGGKDIPKDHDKAYQHARRVAEATGEQYCQYIVGDILLAREKDARQAVFWLTQSGEQGFPPAIEALSRIYFQGSHKGVKQDYEQAREWCLRGDDIWPSGLGYCQTCLGDMYRAGLGVPKDLMRSFEYYQKAASQQDAPQNYARYMLGEMFYKGEGWPKNYAVAAEYYKLAAAEDYEPAKQRLQELTLHEQQQKDAELQKATPSKRSTWRFWSLFGSGRRRTTTAAQ